MHVKELTQSKYFRVIVALVGILVVALVSFASGVAVGFHKARFSYAFGENYERNFVGGGRTMMGSGRGGMLDRDDIAGRVTGRDLRNAHGISGKVLSVSDASMVISDKENEENTVAVTDKTIIKKNGIEVKLGDVVKDDAVVVIGNPSESGVVNADFIRVFGQAAANQ